MSIYTECRDAARTLLDDPQLRGLYANREGVFTKMDIILQASSSSTLGQYDKAEMQEAQREASQVLTGLFNNRLVVRFGPVSLAGLGLEEPDYARLGAEIIYASPEHGPDVLKTPNGGFPRMFVQDDTIRRPGRRLGATRDDFIPWHEQDILGNLTGEEPKLATSGQRELHRLKMENDALRRRVTEAQIEINRLRDQIASRGQPVTRADIEELISTLTQGA